MSRQCSAFAGQARLGDSDLLSRRMARQAVLRCRYRRGVRAETPVSTVSTALDRIHPRLGPVLADFVLERLPARMVETAGERGVKRMGLCWHLNLDANLERSLFYTGSYDSATLSEISDLVEPYHVVLHIGANIGTVALPIARLLDAKLVAASTRSSPRQTPQTAWWTT
jgi:hypothetical protein